MSVQRKLVNYGSLFKRFKSTISKANRCFYEVLEVPRNASREKIRDAYVAKTKKIHPDKNINDPNLHKRFVELNEAYSVLKNAEKRFLYDETRRNPHRMRQPNVTTSNDNPFGRERYRSDTESSYNPDYEDFYYQNFYTAKDFRDFKFAGEEVKKNQRVSNKIVIALLFVLMVFGGGASFAYVVYIRRKCKDHEEKVHYESSCAYESVREKARLNGPRKQLQLLASSKESFLSTDKASISSDLST